MASAASSALRGIFAEAGRRALHECGFEKCDWWFDCRRGWNPHDDQKWEKDQDGGNRAGLTHAASERLVVSHMEPAREVQVLRARAEKAEKLAAQLQQQLNEERARAWNAQSEPR